VRGKGRARLVDDTERAESLTMKLLARYVKPEHLMTKEYAEPVKSGESVVVEIAPDYLTTWDYRKLPPEELKRRRESALP